MKYLKLTIFKSIHPKTTFPVTVSCDATIQKHEEYLIQLHYSFDEGPLLGRSKLFHSRRQRCL
jgi:hypothetical protein